MIQIMTRKISIQIICDEPPQDLEPQWQQDRIEFYKRLEPVDQVRDEKPIPCGTAFARRMRVQDKASELVWAAIYSTPTAEVLRALNSMAEEEASMLYK